MKTFDLLMEVIKSGSQHETLETGYVSTGFVKSGVNIFIDVYDFGEPIVRIRDERLRNNKLSFVYSFSVLNTQKTRELIRRRRGGSIMGDISREGDIERLVEFVNHLYEMEAL